MKIFLCVLAALTLGACAGAPSVTSWSNGGPVSPPQPTIVPGTYTTVAYKSFATGATDPLTLPSDGGIIAVSVDSSKNIAKAVFTSGDASPIIAAFSNTAVGSSPADTIGNLDSNFTSLISNQGNSLVGITPTPSSVGWSYQSFGVWLSGAGPGTISAVSYGPSPTSNANIPVSGTATYGGFAAGIYLNGGVNYVTASLTAQVDFAKGSVNFLTGSSAYSTSIIAPNFTANTALDMIGTLNFKPGTNTFTGTVTNTTTNVMQGTATGKFYGSAAQEMGGVFSLKNSAGDVFVGGFGAKK